MQAMQVMYFEYAGDGVLILVKIMLVMYSIRAVFRSEKDGSSGTDH